VERRVALQAGDQRRRLGAEPGRGRGEGRLEGGPGPVVEGADRHPFEAQRRQQADRQAGQPGLRHHHLDARGRVAARIAAGDAGQAVEGHGGLAAAGAAEHQQRLGGGGGHGLPLLAVEQRGHLGVGGPVARPDPDAERAGPRRRPGAPAEARPRDRGPPPALGRPHQGGAAGGDADQPAPVDHHHAPRLDHAARHPPRERLLVLLAVPVAVEEAGHRRGPPVDHPHAGLALEEGGAAEAVVAHLLPLAQAQVGEVGGGRVRDGAAAAPLHHRPHQPHLLEDGRQVLGGQLPGLLAQLAQPPLQLGAVVARGAAGAQRGQHRGQQRLLLGDEPLLGRRQGRGRRGGGRAQGRPV
jgi:hypothetical protein